MFTKVAQMFFAPVFSLYDYKIKFGRSPPKAKVEGSNPFGSATNSRFYAKFCSGDDWRLAYPLSTKSH